MSRSNNNRQIAFTCALIIGLITSPLAFADVQTYINNTAGSVDNSFDTRTVIVPGGDFPGNQVITGVIITVDFEKEGDNDCGIADINLSWSDEISFLLESPLGSEIDLVYDQTAEGPPSYSSIADADPVVVVFDDSAANKVGTTNGGVPESGTFFPEEPLSTFNNQSPVGTWTFTFGDDEALDLLCFNSFELEITAEDAFPIPTTGQLALVILVLSIFGLARRKIQARV